MYKEQEIKELKQTDMYDWFSYKDPFNWWETGRLKAYNNDTQTAYIVFKCDDDRENRLNYTAEWCKYSDIERFKS